MLVILHFYRRRSLLEVNDVGSEVRVLHGCNPHLRPSDPGEASDRSGSSRGPDGRTGPLGIARGEHLEKIENQRNAINVIDQLTRGLRIIGIPVQSEPHEICVVGNQDFQHASISGIEAHAPGSIFDHPSANHAVVLGLILIPRLLAQIVIQRSKQEQIGARHMNRVLRRLLHHRQRVLIQGQHVGSFPRHDPTNAAPPWHDGLPEIVPIHGFDDVVRSISACKDRAKIRECRRRPGLRQTRAGFQARPYGFADGETCSRSGSCYA